MRDLAKIDLKSLSVPDLHALLRNARSAGRETLAAHVARELASRTSHEAPLPPWAARRRAALGYAAAALVAIVSAGAVFLARDFLPPPFRSPGGEAAATGERLGPAATPRAQMARVPDLASPDVRRAPEARRGSSGPARAAGSVATAPASDVARRPRPPESLDTELELATRPEPPTPAPRGAAEATRLAVSRSPAGPAPDCDRLADASERMVCEDARRGAVNPRIARLSAVPVRVSIVGGVSRQGPDRLSPPGAPRTAARAAPGCAGCRPKPAGS